MIITWLQQNFSFIWRTLECLNCRYFDGSVGWMSLLLSLEFKRTTRANWSQAWVRCESSQSQSELTRAYGRGESWAPLNSGLVEELVWLWLLTNAETNRLVVSHCTTKQVLLFHCLTQSTKLNRRLRVDNDCQLVVSGWRPNSNTAPHLYGSTTLNMTSISDWQSLKHFQSCQWPLIHHIRRMAGTAVIAVSKRVKWKMRSIG